MEVPGGVRVQVVENTDAAVHSTLPTAPEKLSSLLEDSELERIAGGEFVASMAMIAGADDVTLCKYTHA